MSKEVKPQILEEVNYYLYIIILLYYSKES